ncbi:MAG TPA: hypothetical protein VM925_06120 [Labilithrix sp.]|nr:hypothetical protein [Labilithrix sp.]
MKFQYLVPGLAIAAVGFAVLFGLLASVSALAKSKQLSALRAIASGREGSGKRALFFFAVAAMTIGSCGVFGGVAKSDGERANACQRMCVARGYAAGRIGRSATPDPKHPKPACTCTGGVTGATPFETSADDLAF